MSGERESAAQKASKRKSEILDRFFALSANLFCILGPSGAIDQANTALRDCVKTDPKGREFVSLLHPSDAEDVKEELTRLHRGSGTVGFESQLLSASGEFRWVRWTASSDQDGEIYLSGHDVTRRREIEEEMEESNAFLEAVLENIPHMVFVKDADDLAFVKLNRAGEVLLGVKHEELVGKTDLDLFPRADADRFQAADRQTIRGAKLIEIPREPIQTPHGERLLRTKKVPVFNDEGEPLYLVGISEDITEQAKIEEAQARHVAIVRSSEDAIVSMTLDGTVTSWNPGAEAMFGYSAEDMIGTDILRLFPEDRLGEEEELLERLLNNERVRHFETVRRRRDGTVFDASVTLSLLRNSLGEPTGYAKIARDISVRKEAERARARLQTRSESVLENVADGILVTDVKGVISVFNRSAEKIFGYFRGEVIGRNVSVLMKAHDAARHDGYIT
ncbi:MAG: PAS domain S-box protein, partial [Myxococcales bacterium]|nr:PAS domain S-box protein [Myxococcales bacterium]